MDEKSQLTNKSNHENNVLTLVFLGTRQHRETSSPNILTELAKSIDVKDKQHIHLFDGPGCVGTSDHPTPGTYVYDPTIDRKIPNNSAALQLIENWSYELFGTLLGEGVESNIFEALQVIKMIMQKNPHEALTVNMYGFSRGADTINRLAQAIDILYPEHQITINAMLLDPVSGPMRRDHFEATIVPPCVKRYEVCLREHENRPGFEPQDQSTLAAENPCETKINYTFLYGVHGEGLRFRNNEEDDPAVALTWDAVHRFANEIGTRLKLKSNGASYIDYIKTGNETVHQPSQHLTDVERFACYTKMMTKKKDYQKKLLLGLKKRFFTIYKEDYVLSSEYFIDQTHRELFKKLYPEVFNYFFERNSQLHSKDAIQTRLRSILEHDNSLAYSLEIFGLIKNTQGQISIISTPQGYKPPHELLVKEFAALDNLIKRTFYNIINAGNKTDQEFAQLLRNNYYKILRSDLSDSEKLNKIQALIRQICILLREINCKESYLYELEAKILSPEDQAIIINTIIQKASQTIDEKVKATLYMFNEVIKTSAAQVNIDQNERFIMMRAALVEMRNTTLKKNTPALKEFNNKIDMIIKHLPIRPTLADNLIKQLNGYMMRKKFNLTAQKIFQSVSLGLYRGNIEDANQKLLTAKHLIDELKKLISKGMGNNVEEIKQKLKDSRKDAFKHWNQGAFITLLDALFKEIVKTPQPRRTKSNTNNETDSNSHPVPRQLR